MASLTITNPSLKSGEVLSFTFTGFEKNSYVWVGVVGGGGAYFDTNSLGNGSGAFQIGEGPGTYTLECYDEIGHYAEDSFTVVATGVWSVINQCITSVSPRTTASWQTLQTVYATISAPTPQSWSVLQNVTASVGVVTSQSWSILQNINVSIAVAQTWETLQTINTTVQAALPSSWQVLSQVETEVLTGAWVVINEITTVLAPNTWEVVNEINANFGTTDWKVLQVISTLIQLPTGGGEEPEEGTSPWVWALVAGVGILAAASMGKGKPPMTPATKPKQLTTVGKMG